MSLDDLWLKQLGLWNDANPIRSRRLYRVMVVGAIGVSYLIDTLLLGLFWFAGTVDARVPLLYGYAAAGHVLLFSALHWSGYSERFKNAHMTVAQMAYAIAVQLVAITVARQIVSFFLAILFIIFAFGTLRIALREALAVWLLTCLAIAATLGLGDHANLGIASPTGPEVVVVAISFAVILLRTVVLGYYATYIRLRILEKAHSLEIAVDAAEQLAAQDALTGALNRRVILPAITEQISLCQRKDLPACVAMLDIDRFKAVNDTFGHLVGDAVLKRIARTIAERIRQADQFGRYGGEEFILLLPATRLDEGMTLLERIREAIASIAWPDLPAGYRITLSGGLTDVRPEDMFMDVITRADRALYTAKNNGRNRVCRYDLIVPMFPIETAAGDQSVGA
jgi:diguanylate cyclase (GGDEF)-like protein